MKESPRNRLEMLHCSYWDFSSSYLLLMEFIERACLTERIRNILRRPTYSSWNDHIDNSHLPAGLSVAVSPRFSIFLIRHFEDGEKTRRLFIEIFCSSGGSTYQVGGIFDIYAGSELCEMKHKSMWKRVFLNFPPETMVNEWSMRNSGCWPLKLSRKLHACWQEDVRNHIAYNETPRGPVFS